MKILYVTTISNTVNAFLIPHIKMLIDEGHQVDVAFNIEQEVKSDIIKMGCKIHKIPFQRSPLSKDNIKAYKILKKIIMKEQYDLVHTHTPVASAIVRLACKNLNDIIVFYTAHGFHFYKGAPLINWLLYYPVEKLLSRNTDVLITINKEDYKRAKNKFKAKKVEYIPGVGIDIEKFNNLKIDRVLKRKEIGVQENTFVLLSVGELNKNKNHEIVIKALAEINNKNIHYIICGKGPLEGYLKQLSRKLGIEDNIHILGFRKDIPEICKSADAFIFPSFREGLGLAALEAMASGLPIITSNVHGIVDYSINGETGYSINPLDQDGFKDAIISLLNNHELSAKMGKNNIKAVKEFEIKNIINKVLKIYRLITL